ncbi:hypothetical protein OJF2_35360 [Aquisphaera giovannonii]|uniref:Uncharacterized protein n=1 Tax=Aquisphaera giovannonii TaxID=406548 RepID=A0A5B9W4J4_9BACT|nr:hypothetical protein [Aquisphaera giovannonii]QEH34991.1 hypothetical protein OJF2_35360 [Aquisphaera giovannonii]
MNGGIPGWSKALLSGLVGASVVTLIHETVRRVHPDAPRMDTLGRRAIASGLEAAGMEVPPEDELQAAALGGDIVSNALYYSLVGLGSPAGTLARGVGLGAAAGLGAVALPPVLGLGGRPSARTPQTAAMAFSWYLIGGLAAALAHRGITSMTRPG